MYVICYQQNFRVLHNKGSDLHVDVGRFGLFFLLFREYFAHIDKSPLSVKNEIKAHFRQLWTFSGEGSRILAVQRGLGFLFEISSEA